MVAGYDDIFGAADHVTEILEARPIGCECFDHALVRGAERRLFPEGAAWAFVELGGETTADSDARARALAQRLRSAARPPRAVALIDDPARARRLWEVREAGLAASSRPPGEPDHYPGWEDAAVAPEDLGRYLRGLRDLYDRFGYTGAFYGHLGDGCIHSRANFDLMSPAGLAAYRAFIEEAADLVVSFGGSLSGEHGDGQQRAELLPKMFGDELVAAFGEFKAIWDPDGGMNPGKVVNPRRLDQDLRVGPRSPRGGFAGEVQRCVGVGKCRRPDPGSLSGALRGASGGVMCPSFAVTRDEQHSTRGRARLLFEMLQGDVVTSGWRSPEVAGALDLCLACKGCTSECPAGVDLPSYKAEFLHHHCRDRVRPRQAYAFGLIDQVARVGSKLPGLANRVAASRALKLAAGMAPGRPVPALAAQTLQQWFVRRADVNPDGPRVLLWPDTFSNYFDPSPAIAAVEAMEAAGWRVLLPEGHGCCGRPLYDYGFLGLAERYLRRVLEAVGPALAEGLPVVGVEPSCVATLRHELPRMLPRDDEALALGRQALHFGEFFERYGIEPPRALAPGLRAHLWVHCHQKATGGGGPDRRLLEAMGAEVVALPGTCCAPRPLGGHRGAGPAPRRAGDRAWRRRRGERLLVPDADRPRDGTPCPAPCGGDGDGPPAVAVTSPGRSRQVLRRGLACGALDLAVGAVAGSPLVVVRGALNVFKTDGEAQLLDVLTDVLVVEPLRPPLHHVGQAVGDGVQLVLGGLVLPGLAVLQQGHHQEGDDGGRRVDLEMELCVEEGLRVAFDQDRDEALEKPERHQQDTEGEEGGTAGEEGRPPGEAVEEADTAAHVAWHQELGILPHDHERFQDLQVLNALGCRGDVRSWFWVDQPWKHFHWLNKSAHRIGTKEVESVSTNPELEAQLSSHMDELREAGAGSEAERLAEIIENPDAAVPAGGAAVEVSDAAQERTDEVIAKAEEARAAFAKAGAMDEIEQSGGTG